MMNSFRVPVRAVGNTHNVNLMTMAKQVLKTLSISEIFQLEKRVKLTEPVRIGTQAENLCSETSYFNLDLH